MDEKAPRPSRGLPAPHKKGSFPFARLSVPKRPMKPDTSAVAEVSLNPQLPFPVTIHSDRVCGEATEVSSKCAPTRTPAEGNRARAITAAAASMTGINPIHTINHPERAEPTRSVPVKIGVTKPFTRPTIAPGIRRMMNVPTLMLIKARKKPPVNRKPQVNNGHPERASPTADKERKRMLADSMA